MDINQLRCFIVLGDELHFGRAARKLEMMPASLSRFIRLLEEDLGIRLLNRSTRNVTLTTEGAEFLSEAKTVVSHFDALKSKFKRNAIPQKKTVRIGAIDTAARGLLPNLLNIFVRQFPDADIHVMEEKSYSLIPRLMSGWLDVVFIRPPENIDVTLTSRLITHEHFMLAVPAGHRLAEAAQVTIDDFCEEPIIIPERRSRPHSHDLTMNLYKLAGRYPVIAHYADEKQTILSFVAAGLGVALVPASYKNMNADGVIYLPLNQSEEIAGLPLSVMWHHGTNNSYVNALLTILDEHHDFLTANL